MELETITMPRQLPRKKRIMSETSADASSASRSTSCTDARTNLLWSKSSFSSIPCGAAFWSAGSMSRTESTTVSVDEPALRRMARYVERCPFTWTTFVCTA